MRKIYPRVFLFLSAFIGALFSFFFLIDRPIHINQITSIEHYASYINSVLFFISLFLMVYVFFFSRKLRYFFSCLLILLGLLYITLMFSFNQVNYYYLIPIGLYIFTGFIVTS